jgi:signal peptidase I
MSTDNSTTLRFLRYAHALFGSLFTIFLVVLLLNSWVLTIFRVNGHSMDPTLQNRQLLLVDLLSLRYSPPKENEIVIVNYAGDSSFRFVKRVIATPGDTVEYNGQNIVLGDDQYFIEGDNRDHSTDSRTYGPIKKSQIIGRVLFIH